MNVSVLSWVVDSLVDNILLVEVVDVHEGPDGLEDHGQDHEDAGGAELSSSGSLVLGEEHHKEGACQDQEDVGHEGHHWVVPSEVIIQNQGEVVCDEAEREEQGEDSNRRNTTLDWEATAACLTFGFNVGAGTKAAAAWLNNVFWSFFK